MANGELRKLRELERAQRAKNVQSVQRPDSYDFSHDLWALPSCNNKFNTCAEERLSPAQQRALQRNRDLTRPVSTTVSAPAAPQRDSGCSLAKLVILGLLLS